MIVVVITCVIVIAVLVFVHVRQCRRIDELEGVIRQIIAERDRADEARAEAQNTAVESAAARDDALERVNRAKRDAAEVANRLSDERERVGGLEAELAASREEVATLERAAERDDSGILWELMRRHTEHTWLVSIAVGEDEPSPFESDADPFRTAVEIEVDAAREEAGAAVELAWSGDEGARVAPARAALTVALVRDVLGALGTSAASITIAIDISSDHIDVAIAAEADDGSPIEIVVPDGLETVDQRLRIG